ncbi:MAG: HAD family acid phosphatase [Nannocystaceae bacterium]
MPSLRRFPQLARRNLFAVALLLGASACADDGDGGDGQGGSSGSDGTSGASEQTSASASTTVGTTASTSASTGGGSSSDGGGTTDAADSSSDGGSSGGSTGGGVCTDMIPAVVTDIDETLTLSDAEFLLQLADGNYDPVERDGASEMINGYADRGYRVLYLTSRAETLMTAVTNETAREATERWLMEHEFPLDPDKTMVILSPNLVLGDSAQAYKADALMMLQAEGWQFEYAYGNATSDIGAYAEAGIALDHTFIIGPHAGEGGTMAVAGDGWVDHASLWLPGVPPVCEAA